MFCTACGKQNAEGSTFCTSCGTPLVQKEAQPQPQQPVYQQPVYQQPVYQQPVYQQPIYQQPVYQQPVYQQPVYQPAAAENEWDFASYFRQKWRIFVASPLPLIITILYSLLSLLTLINIFDGASTLNAIANALPFMRKMLRELGDTLTFLELLAFTPTFLTALGMWLVFAGAAKKDISPLNTSGLNMIRIGQVITLVLHCLLYAVITIGLFGASEYISDSNAVTMFLLIGIMVFSVVVQAKTISMLSAMRDCGVYDRPNASGVTFIAVMQFIVGSLQFLVLVYQIYEFEYYEPSFNTILGLVMPFLYGVVLMLYKGKMNSLQADYDAVKYGV